MKLDNVDKKLFTPFLESKSVGGETLASRVLRWLSYHHSGEYDGDAARLLEEAVTGCTKVDKDGMVPVVAFPPSYYPETFTEDKAFGKPKTYIPLDYFLLMQTMYQMNNNDLNKLPWEFEKLLKKLRSAISVACPTFWSRLIEIFKWLLIGAASGGLAYLCYWVSDVKNFGGSLVALICWCVFIPAAIASGVCLLGFLGSLFVGPSKQDNENLKKAYVDILRFIRLRVLWCKDATGKDAVAEYLVDAQKQIEKTAKPARRKLRRLLGSGWKMPKESVLNRDALRTGPRVCQSEQPKTEIDVEKASELRLAALHAYVDENNVEKAGQLYYQATLADPSYAMTSAEYYLNMDGADPELAEKICLLAEPGTVTEFLLQEIWQKGVDHYRKRLQEKFKAKHSRVRDEFYFYHEAAIRPDVQKAAYFTRKLVDAGMSKDYFWCVNAQIFTAETVDEAKELCRWIDLYRKRCDNDADINIIMRRAGNCFHKLAGILDNEKMEPLSEKLYGMLAARDEVRCMCELGRRYINAGRYEEAQRWVYVAKQTGGNEHNCKILQNAINNKSKAKLEDNF